MFLPDDIHSRLLLQVLVKASCQELIVDIALRHGILEKGHE